MMNQELQQMSTWKVRKWFILTGGGVIPLIKPASRGWWRYSCGALIHYYTLGFNAADEDNGMFISLPQWMNTKDKTWDFSFLNMQILRSLECGEHSCAALWCLMSLPLWLESRWWQEDRWTSLHSDWLQTRPNKPSGTPEQEVEGCPRRNLELEGGGKTSHKLVPRTRSWV